jgi:hypothetical protein
MTREELKHRIQIAQAWMDGKRVQCKAAGSSAGWLDVPMVNSVSHEYAPRFFFDTDVEWRLKPEPRDWWICKACHTVWRSQTGMKCCNGEFHHVREVL